MPELVSIEEKISYSLPEISEAVKTLLNTGKDLTIWALYGAMGSGKTTFTKSLMVELGSELAREDICAWGRGDKA